MKKSDVIFMALGGGQSVGASSYFLRMGSTDVLLDCGSGTSGGIPFAPNMDRLVENGLIGSVNQIGQVFISHAHLDHIGYLHEFATLYKQPFFFMTDITMAFARFQFAKFMRNPFVKRKLLDIDEWVRTRVSCVSYKQEIPLGGCRVSFWEAGHIPGAMMTLFRFGNRRILYTGDYSLNPTFWTRGCILPEESVDILILCGLHARHPQAIKKGHILGRLLNKIYESFGRHRPVYCAISQLSKGIEMIRSIRSSELRDYPIFLDPQVYNVVNAMESLGIPILDENTAPWKRQDLNFPHIVVGTGKRPPKWYYTVIRDDFTLHDDFQETALLIKKINPRLAIIVHSPPSANPQDLTVEQVLLQDGDCRTQFIFAEEGEIYVC